MGINYLFFNTDSTLSNGREIEKDKFHILGKAEQIKSLLGQTFNIVEWELYKNGKNQSWLGMSKNCNEPYIDVSIPFNENNDVHFVIFSKSSAQTLKIALGALKTNNVFANADEQIIYNL